ncbi:MAG: hypothetical protein KDD27_11350 [Saprospiraceae bacterium]|nr:hypothetical protein [Saprospiraceae bacterium]
MNKHSLTPSMEVPSFCANLKVLLMGIFFLFAAQANLSAQCETCCNGSKPKTLTLLYNGKSCSETVTCQASGKWSCSGGGPNNASSVYITASKNSNGSGGTYFAGSVALNAPFTVNSATGGSNTFPANTYFRIFSSQGGTLLQTVGIHTSCSTPLVTGDQLGALMINNIILADNTNCGPPPTPCTATFTNQGTETVRLWQYFGNNQWSSTFTTIQPGATHTQQVGDGQVWEIWNLADNTKFATFTIDCNGNTDYCFTQSGPTSCTPPETCPVPVINAPGQQICPGVPVTFSAQDLGFPCLTYTWNFGSNATPSTATGLGPISVVFSSAGNVNVSLTAANNCQYVPPPNPPVVFGCCDQDERGEHDHPHKLILEYVGSGSPNVIFRGTDGPSFTFFSGQVSNGSVFVVDGTGHTDKHGEVNRLDTDTEFQVGSGSFKKVHTSCSQDISPGFGISNSGALIQNGTSSNSVFIVRGVVMLNTGSSSSIYCEEGITEPGGGGGSGIGTSVCGAQCFDCEESVTITIPVQVCDPCLGQGGDSDGDGVCNNQDCQPNNPAFPATPGTPCNDGNPNTNNDVIQADGCSCAGTLLPCVNQGGDSDGDGVCNNQDCAPNNPNLPTTPGTACNDGNANTTNDVIQADGCSCAGTPVVCNLSATFTVPNGCLTNSFLLFADANDPYFPPNNPLYTYSYVIQPQSSVAGISTVDPRSVTVTFNSPGLKTVTATITNPAVPNCQIVKVATFTVSDCSPCANLGGDSDGDGVCNNQDCAPNNPNLPTTPGTACNDGNPNTTNDVIQADGCTCAGTLNPCANQGGDSDGDGVCNNQDCKPFDPFYPTTPGTPCNDGNQNTTNDVVQADGCSCAGTPNNTPDCVNGINISTANGKITVTGLDGAPVSSLQIFSSTWQPIFNCFANCGASQMVTVPAGTYYVYAKYYTAGYSLICEKQATVTVGGSCPDADNDGTCDANDCQPNNPAYPATPGTPCNDGNPNTANDVVQADGCSCAGTPSGTPDCVNGIGITAGNGTINVTGLDGAPVSSLQVFSATWQPIFNCFANCGASQSIPVPAGTYYVYAKYYTAGYSLICEKQLTITVGGNPVCDNVTNGGSIGFGTGCTASAQYCPNTGSAPAINSCTAPSGGTGNLEIVWLKSTTSCSAPTTSAAEIAAGLDPHWTMIPGATGLSYQPGNVTQQTCFLRCSRRAGCPNFIESNIITLGISSNCGGGTGNPNCANISITTGNGSITVSGLDGAPITSVQIFSAAWQTEHNCFANCQSPVATYPVPAGAHYVYVKYYSAQYQLICEVNQTVNVTQNLVGSQSENFQFEAIKHLEHVELAWLHKGDYKVDEYILERSADGQGFEEIYELPSEKDASADLYQGYDLEPLTGMNHYRVKMLNEDGTVGYSEVKVVEYEDLVDFVLFPNPANQFTTINLESIVGYKDVDIHIYNNLGLRLKHFHLDEVWGKYYQMDLRELNEGHYSVWVNIPGRRPRTVQLVIGRL